MPKTISQILLLSAFLLAGQSSVAQPPPPRSSFWTPADTLDARRFGIALGSSAALYAAGAATLWHIWYQGYELTGFHTFNDLSEWEQMDKVGHVFSTYAESYMAFKGARWTGIPHRKAVWLGVGAGMLIQTTIEVMDGFSAKWGFSWPDMAGNALGAGLFAGQELLWQEQRLLMKMSNTRPRYSREPLFTTADGGLAVSPRDRAYELYGASLLEALFKDYNGQTLWLSVNPSAFMPEAGGRFPRWLNLAVGYSAENMFGGVGNGWVDEAGNAFRVAPNAFPRYRQFYLSLDVDLTRIRTRSPFLRSLFTAINWIKIPAPALEVNSRGGVLFHPLRW